MDELTKVLDALSAELLRQITDLSSCDSREERRVQAETVHLLSQSLSSIIESTSMAADGMHDYMDGEFPDEEFLD
ncbi:MAG: hypothetical protein P1P84_04470 [Deferrisomatales bacterium]|nr:hypothetical protein [Deferrisomatales bacterium]